jgi:hypothetical protein
MVYAAATMSGKRQYLGRKTRQQYGFLRAKLKKLQGDRARKLWQDPELRIRMSFPIGNKYREGISPNVTQKMRDKLKVSMKGNKNSLGYKRPPDQCEAIKQRALDRAARKRAEADGG